MLPLRARGEGANSAQSPAPDPERCSGVKTCCCFPVLTWALPFALGTCIFCIHPPEPLGYFCPCPHRAWGGWDQLQSNLYEVVAQEVVAGICRVGVPVPGASTHQGPCAVWWGDVPSGHLACVPSPRPWCPLGASGGLLPCPRPVSSSADADEQTFPSALLRDALNPGSGWLLARPPEGPRGWLSSLLSFQRLQKAARLHLIQIY